jgi:hypothetical protein
VDLARREISAMAALALLGGAAITIMGCGGGGSNPTSSSAAPPATPSPIPAPSGDKVGQVMNDPRHTAVITAAQLAAGGALTLDIQGSAPHNHVVELTAQEVASIRSGQRVDKGSSTDFNHFHLVIFS